MGIDHANRVESRRSASLFGHRRCGRSGSLRVAEVAQRDEFPARQPTHAFTRLQRVGEIRGDHRGVRQRCEGRGVDVGDVLWNVLKKPDVSPELETPMEDREMTLGKGCKACGGRASKPITQGTGIVNDAKCGESSYL